MKILNRLKTDAKIIIRDLHNANDSLIDTVVEYQQIIFEQRETIDCQSQEIERLQHRNLELQHQILNCKSEAIKEFAKRLKQKCDWFNKRGEPSGCSLDVIDKVLKEMVGDSE